MHFVHSLKRGSTLKTTTAVTYSGRQPTGVYAMNTDCFISKEGELVNECGLTWLKRELFVESDKIVSDDISSTIVLPLSNTRAVDFYISLKKCLNHNALPGIMVVAGALMSFHYQAVIDKCMGCPIVVATGPSGTGKTTSIRAALSLFGRTSIFSKGTNAGILERATRSTIPFGIDDPAKCKSNNLDLGELCIDLYNGQKTVNMRTGSCRPMSTAIMATNFPASTHGR